MPHVALICFVLVVICGHLVTNCSISVLFVLLYVLHSSEIFVLSVRMDSFARIRMSHIARMGMILVCHSPVSLPKILHIRAQISVFPTEWQVSQMSPIIDTLEQNTFV